MVMGNAFSNCNSSFACSSADVVSLPGLSVSQLTTNSTEPLARAQDLLQTHSQSPNCRLRLLCPWSPSQGPEPRSSDSKKSSLQTRFN
jgi:hypothetical protein